MLIMLQTTTHGLCCCSSTCLQHSILSTNRLLRQLNHPFGVRGTSHKWVDSYLNERSQYVRVGDRVSSSVSCHYKVPQGSVLGPLLFTIYTSPIVSVIAPFRNVHHAQYADDTQLYITLTRHSALSMTVSSPSIVGWTPAGFV